ncbi:MAG: hypothetical protein Q9165_004785 [Trypethelium subeluteriae]
MDANWQSLTPERPNNLKRRATFESDDDNQPLESPPSEVKKHRQRSAIDNISLVPISQATPSSAVLHLLTHSPLPVLPTPQQTFIRLGLFHPSGSQPLDAIVLLDWRGRRRLVVPFGWGAGKWVSGTGGNSNAHHAEELMGALGDSVRELSVEWEGSVERAEWEERMAMGMDGEAGQAGAGAENDDANGEMAIDE